MTILSRNSLIIIALAAMIAIGSEAPEKNGILLVPTGPGKYHLYYDGHQDIITAIDLDSALIKKVLSAGSVTLFDTVYDPAGFWGINLARVIARTDIVRQGSGVRLEGMDGEIKIYPQHVKPEEKIFPNFRGRIAFIFAWLIIGGIFLRTARLIKREYSDYAGIAAICSGLISLLYLDDAEFYRPSLVFPWLAIIIA
jgi:hypothetical protein